MILRISTFGFVAMWCAPGAVQGQQDLLASAQDWIVNGEDSRFVIEDGEPVLQLRGSAALADFEFANGSVSFDVRLTNRAGFVGFQFRTSPGNAEHVYLRPHRRGEWDAIQYQPIMNGSSTWQLYRGEGYTSPVALPAGEWIHVRIRVHDGHAQLFVGETDEPTMNIVLERGATSGGLAFTSGFRDEAPPGDIPGSFRRLIVDQSPVDPIGDADPAPGTHDGFIRTWDVSDPVAVSSLPVTQLPETAGGWTPIGAESRGVVNLNRYYSGVQGAAHSAVVARTIVVSDHDTVIPLHFDFSDAVSVFLNDHLIFSGTNSWQSRYPYYLGVLHPESLLNTVWLTLQPGENRLDFVVSEAAFGWGFAARAEGAAGVRWLSASEESGRNGRP